MVNATMNDTTAPSITQLLVANRDGGVEQFNQVYERVYPDLKKIAHRELARHRRGHTLDTTALVHEAYEKLLAHEDAQYENRAHFMAVAATAMRHIIIDAARRRLADKRGGDAIKVDIDDVPLSVEDQAYTLLAIDRALEKLTTLNSRLTRVFECRFFAGMSETDTAQALDISLRTVQRDFMKSKALLREFINT